MGFGVAFSHFVYEMGSDSKGVKIGFVGLYVHESVNMLRACFCLWMEIGTINFVS